MTAARIRRRGTAVSVAALASLAVAAAGCSSTIVTTQASDTVDKSLATTVSQVEVDMFNGAIEIRPGPDGTVSATVTRTGTGADKAAALADAQKIDVTLTETDGVAVLKATYTPDPQKPDTRGASAVVTVPAASVLVLKTSNGAITMSGVTGTTVADTSNAAITATGPMEALRAKTSNGKISVVDGHGLISLESSNAAVDVKASEAVVQVETSNGGITFAGSLAVGSSRLHTSNAPVAVTLPKDAAFTVDAQTSNAKISNDFPVSGGSSTDDRVAGTVGGGGGATLVIETSNGEIRLTAS
jgi:hypothetical protein